MDEYSTRFKGYLWMISVLLGFLLTTEQCSGYRVPTGREDQLGKLSRYDIITPYRVVGRERRQANTNTQDGHIQETSLVVEALGNEFILDINLNEFLFSPSYVERSYANDGGAIARKPHAHHHCYYHGTVRGANKSSVAISTCNGISGVFQADEESYFIEPLQDSAVEHLVYRPEDRLDQKTLVYDFDASHDGALVEEETEETSAGHRTRRDIHAETKFIELVIVNDYQDYLRHDENVTKIEERSKELANIVDMIYRQMNVRVALVGVETWTQGDPFQVSTNPSVTMGEFQRWRKDYLLPKIKNDNAQFITGVSFEGSTVGMASLGTMCSDERSGGVSQDHDSIVAVVASTVAHEMGHNLGLIHDTSDRNCQCEAPASIGCVMEPSSGQNPPTNFSSCSRDDLETSLEKGLGACLFDYPDQIFDGPICGNGFLEIGEECDCGTAEECSNDCCIAATCRLHENATCAVGACCEECQLMKAGEVCRDIRNVCDLPEYCTGMSAKCPANVYMQNGETCANTVDGTCYDGQCLTYDDQCEKVWGPGAKKAHELCFRFNNQGSSFGNCGGSQSSFQACEDQNVKCGKLMCHSGSSFPVLSSLAKASQGYIWDNNSNQHTCKSTSIDLGGDVPDPGYVATGTECQPGFVCSDFKCQNLSTLNIRPCPHNCNGNGICNSENHCHCDPQWNPPLCNTPGYGGSIDSGPARHSDQPGGANSSTVIVLLVMFLCVLPALTIIGILVYCKRQTLSKMVNKGTTRPSSSTKQYQWPESRGASSTSSGPSRRAPPKPVIHHTHMSHQAQPERQVFTYPASRAPAPPSAVRPPPPAPINRTRDAPIVHQQPPAVSHTKRPATSSVAPPVMPSAPKPIRPSPPKPLNKPPSPVRSPPSVPAPAGVTIPPKPSAIHSANKPKPQFRLPPPINSSTESAAGAPPGPLKKPPVRPARPQAVVKPLPSTRPKPNINRNNSTEIDESSTFVPPSELPKSDSSSQESSAPSTKPPPAPSKPALPHKPVPPKKPVVPSKPTEHNKTALKPPIKRDPVV